MTPQDEEFASRLGERTAEAVLAAIGDQLKMPEPMIKYLGEVNYEYENRYSHFLPGSRLASSGIRVDFRYTNKLIHVDFQAINGVRLMRRTFHA